MVSAYTGPDASGSLASPKIVFAIGRRCSRFYLSTVLGWLRQKNYCFRLSGLSPRLNDPADLLPVS
jgi:hypothetical protein